MALLVLAALLLGACGDLENEGDGDNSRAELTNPNATTDGGGQPKPELPALPAGQVLLDGQLAGSLTQQVTDDFRSSATSTGLAIDVAATDADLAESFGRLCAGEIDIVDTSRRITDEELEKCADNGLEVVDFQVAFDAAVVVTRNERDVGADCVNFDQLRAMFAAGTPVTAWNQINPNFFPIQLTTVGPEQDSSDFQFFGQRVLGVADPTLADFRSDFQTFPRDNQIRHAVAGSKADGPAGAPPGTVGIIGFSFYELFEDKLRPLEIDGQSGDRCVFPSEETISSELYPLERTLRLYTTQRSLDRQEVQEYLRFYLERSEDLANDLELIPISDAIRRQEIARVDDPLAYGDSSEPSPQGTVSTTPTTPVPGTPSGSGVETAPESSDSSEPTTTTDDDDGSLMSDHDDQPAAEPPADPMSDAGLDDLRDRLGELQDRVELLGSQGVWPDPPAPPAPAPAEASNGVTPEPARPQPAPAPRPPDPGPIYVQPSEPIPPPAAAPQPPRRRASEPPPAPEPEPAPAPVATNGHSKNHAEVSARSTSVALVDAGPFDDLIQLRHFEDELASLNAVRDVRVRRFGHGRASIEVGMTGPYMLGRELFRLDREMSVTDGAGGDLIVDLAPTIADEHAEILEEESA